MGVGNVGSSASRSNDGTARKSFGRGRLARLAVLGVLALIIALLPTGAGAVHDLGLFQLDGNTTVDPSPPAPFPGEDWNPVYAGTSSAFSSRFVDAAVEAPAVDTTYFSGGGSKDVNDIDEWKWSANDVSPDKNQILDAFAAAYVDPSNNHTILYFGMDRFDTNGDSNVGFWFLQDPAFSVGPNGVFTGKHVEGDLFVVSAFGNGGSVPTIDLYEWHNGALTPLSQGDVGCTTAPVDDEACDAVNSGTTPIVVPWPYQDKDGHPNHSVAQNGFFEGGIDLNLALGDAELPCFTSVIGETRSSDSTSAQLKDFAWGQLNSCGSIELKKRWVGTPSSTTIKIGKTAGAGDVASKLVTSDDTTGPKDVKPGNYFVSESPNPPTADYSVTLACQNEKTTPATPVSPGTGNSVPVALGDKIVCTFTNTFVKKS